MSSKQMLDISLIYWKHTINSLAFYEHLENVIKIYTFMTVEY
jgi:hypothetical protein